MPGYLLSVGEGEKVQAGGDDLRRDALDRNVGWVERSETHRLLDEDDGFRSALPILLRYPSYFASDATPSISISIAGFGSATTTQVVRAG
jgi:hypothetical protein